VRSTGRAQPPRRLPTTEGIELMRLMIFALVLILLFGALPLLSTLLAVLFASAFGCSVNEGFVDPCVVLGHDFGGLLYSMGLTFWFAMFTVPLAGLALLVWLVVLVVLLFRRRRRRAAGVVE
jgi:hypothetical protein